MERLRKRYQWSHWQPGPKWSEEKASWKRIGISSRKVTKILERASLHRIMYEDRLELMARAPADRTLFEGDKRKLENLLHHKQTQALISLLDSERAPFSPPGILLEKQLQEYAAWFMMHAPIPRQASKDRHRPGEPWAKPFICQLADLFQKTRFSRLETTKAVYRAFALAGHADVITESKIRRFLWRNAKGKRATATPHPAVSAVETSASSPAPGFTFLREVGISGKYRRV